MSEAREDVTFGYLPLEGHDPNKLPAYTPQQGSHGPPFRAIDLRHLAPNARFQGPIGACTGFSTRGAIRGLMRAAVEDGLWEGESFDPSPLAIYAGARQRLHMLSSDSGVPLSAVADVLREGIPREQLWPFNPQRWAELPPADVWTDAKGHQLVNSTLLRHDTASIRAAFNDGCILVTGVPVYDGPRGMTSAAAFRDGDVSMPSSRDSIVGWHALSLWGHDPVGDVVFFQQSWEGFASSQNGFGTLPINYVLRLANELMAFGAIQ